jgi:hypothetical protein
MMDQKELKEVTYSSEYVAKLERKLEQARKENIKLKREKWLLDCSSSFYLEVYKQALKQAIGDAMPYVSDWSLMIAEGYEEYADLFRECINDKSSIEGIATFYFMLVAKNKDKEEWSKRK